MRQTKIIRHDARDPKMGMTVDELQAFVQALADTEFHAGAYVVKIRTTWHSTIKSLQITIEHEHS